MPSRRDIFTDNSFYHIFNKTIDHKKVFLNEQYAYEFLQRAWFYRSKAARVRYSFYKNLTGDMAKATAAEIDSAITHSVEFIAYCLMPNHFHFLLRQKRGGSVRQVMSNILNAFTRYYNTREKREGPLFLPRFQSRMIVREEQFIHTTRYIHLNPYSAGLVSDFDKLAQYRHSSYAVYVRERSDRLVNREILFKYMNSDMKRYEQFVNDNAEHQRMLEHIKHADTWK